MNSRAVAVCARHDRHKCRRRGATPLCPVFSGSCPSLIPVGMEILPPPEDLGAQ